MPREVRTASRAGTSPQREGSCSGGAGRGGHGQDGKTTVAAAAVRKILDDARAPGAPKRALFLSFSRAAVDQIIDRTSDTFGRQAEFVEITTFHAFAWHLIRRWGSAIGLPRPKLISPSEAKLFGTSSGITYDDLFPLALKLLDIPAVCQHLERVFGCVKESRLAGSEVAFDLVARQAAPMVIGERCLIFNQVVIYEGSRLGDG